MGNFFSKKPKKATTTSNGTMVTSEERPKEKPISDYSEIIKKLYKQFEDKDKGKKKEDKKTEFSDIKEDLEAALKGKVGIYENFISAEFEFAYKIRAHIDQEEQDFQKGKLKSLSWFAYDSLKKGLGDADLFIQGLQEKYDLVLKPSLTKEEIEALKFSWPKCFLSSAKTGFQYMLHKKPPKTIEELHCIMQNSIDASVVKKKLMFGVDQIQAKDYKWAITASETVTEEEGWRQVAEKIENMFKEIETLCGVEIQREIISPTLPSKELLPKLQKYGDGIAVQDRITDALAIPTPTPTKKFGRW